MFTLQSLTLTLVDKVNSKGEKSYYNQRSFKDLIYSYWKYLIGHSRIYLICDMYEYMKLV